MSFPKRKYNLFFLLAENAFTVHSNSNSLFTVFALKTFFLLAKMFGRCVFLNALYIRIYVRIICFYFPTFIPNQNLFHALKTFNTYVITNE